jgi:hypothetical protein
MTEERRYRMQELVTTGWEDIDEEWNSKLTREQCSTKLQEYIDGGVSPGRLRAVNDNV